jgi:hypothetical protein
MKFLRYTDAFLSISFAPKNNAQRIYRKLFLLITVCADGKTASTPWQLEATFHGLP